MSPERRMEYALSDRRAQFRIAAENPAKMTRVAELIKSHPGASILIIGEYVTQIQSIARQFNLPPCQWALKISWIASSRRSWGCGRR